MARVAGLTISAVEAGKIAGGDRPYSADMVRRLYRDGRFPEPIDAGLPVRSWRWSRPEVELYAAGKWKPSPRPVRPPATGAPLEPVELPAAARGAA